MSLIVTLLPALMGIIDKFFPNAEDSNKAKSELIAKVMDMDTKQMEVNQQEAANQNLFVSGWRPGVAWMCVGMWSLYYVMALVVNPIMVFNGHTPLTLPDISVVENLLYALLGLGSLRTIEKLKLK